MRKIKEKYKESGKTPVAVAGGSGPPGGGNGNRKIFPI
jgi:hypothetical protein